MERIPAKIILDLGIGQGGNYLQRDPTNVLRVGIDTQIHRSLLYKKRVLTALEIIKASADQIPLRDSVADEIQIYFPYQRLLMPGLQWPEIPEITWYEEFFRVLKPNGTLIIWADHLLVIETANMGASRYFENSKKEYLYQEDLLKLGSTTAINTAEPHNKNILTPLGIKLTMSRRVRPQRIPAIN